MGAAVTRSKTIKHWSCISQSWVAISFGKVLFCTSTRCPLNSDTQHSNKSAAGVHINNALEGTTWGFSAGESRWNSKLWVQWEIQSPNTRWGGIENTGYLPLQVLLLSLSLPHSFSSISLSLPSHTHMNVYSSTSAHTSIQYTYVPTLGTLHSPLHAHRGAHTQVRKEQVSPIRELTVLSIRDFLYSARYSEEECAGRKCSAQGILASMFPHDTQCGCSLSYTLGPIQSIPSLLPMTRLTDLGLSLDESVHLYGHSCIWGFNSCSWLVLFHTVLRNLYVVCICYPSFSCS